MSPDAADAWDVALRWTGPVDLGPAWSAGQPVRLPNWVTIVEADGPLYLRSGQPPAPSALYRLTTELQHLDGDSAIAVAPIGHGVWRLPCRAGVVSVHREFGQPRRVVVRIDDTSRWIYVQRSQVSRDLSEFSSSSAV